MRILLGLVLSLALSGSAFAGMKASFEWGPTGKCFDSKSPPFKVSGVPAGTTKLSFLMKDLDAPDFYHGGGKVDYTGQSDLPYGAFRYKGPCPPTKHRYTFTIKALDAMGKELETASVAKSFP